jgi:hypothetical protein
MVLTLIAAVAVVAVGVLLARGDSPPPRGDTGPPVGSLVLVDPRTNRVEQVIRGAFITSVGQGVPVVPEVASGEGSVWILGGQGVSAVDPRQGDRWGTTPLGYTFGDQGFGVGYRTVWVRIQSRVERINPATGGFLQSTTHPDWTDFGGELAIGREGVWVGDRGSIFRLDPQSGEVIARIDLPGTVDHLAVGAGSLWVADELAGKIFRIDPKESRLVADIPVSGGLDDIAVGEGHVWIIDSTAGTLTSIRADTGDVRDPVRIGSDPTALDVGLGAAWVAGGMEGTVTRINPQTGEQQEISVGGPVSDVTVDEEERFIWVTIS